MDKNIVRVKKIFIVVLAVIVSLLVLYALYTNKSKFYDPDKIVRYSQITIDETTDINKIIDEFSNYNNKERLISEIKKVNNLTVLNNQTVYGKTLFIPVMEN